MDQIAAPSLSAVALIVMAKRNTDTVRRGLLQSGTALALGGLVNGGSVNASVAGKGSLVEQVMVEMRETRNYLANWFGGKIEKPEDPGDFYLQNVLADNFHIVRPNGIRLNREQTLAAFYGKLYGSDLTVLRHDNDNIITILDTDTVAIVGYDESHVYQTHKVTNKLTAVFLKNDNAPNGASWLVVHETPIAGDKQ